MIGLSIAERRKVASNVAGHLLGLHIAGGVLALLLLASLVCAVLAIVRYFQGPGGPLGRLITSGWYLAVPLGLLILVHFV